jgi:hypothetical protein
MPKSTTEFFPGVEVLPFLGERGDKQHGAPSTEVVFGQARDGFVSRSSSKRREPWIVNVIDVDKGTNDADQWPSRNILIDQGCFKCPGK